MLKQAHGKLWYGSVAAVEVPLLPVFALSSRFELREGEDLGCPIVPFTGEPHLIPSKDVFSVDVS
jgi:hypothetical protein